MGQLAAMVAERKMVREIVLAMVVAAAMAMVGMRVLVEMHRHHRCLLSASRQSAPIARILSIRKVFGHRGPRGAFRCVSWWLLMIPSRG